MYEAVIWIGERGSVTKRGFGTAEAALDWINANRKSYPLVTGSNVLFYSPTWKDEVRGSWIQ